MSLYSKLINSFVMIFSFLFIYAANIVGLPNFSYLGILVIPFLVLILPRKKYVLNLVKNIVYDKTTIRFISSYLFVLLLVITYSTFRNTYDYGFAQPILHSIVSIPACIIIACHIFSSTRYYKNKLMPIYNFFRFILYLQVFFIIIMLVSPDAAETINSITKTQTQVDRMAAYHGSRGLGVSGSLAYGLAVTMAILVYLVFFLKFILKDYKLNFIDFSLLILSLIASFSAGRTAIAGIGLLILSFFVISISKYKWTTIIKFLVFIPLLVILVSTIIINIDVPTVTRYVNYVFQPIKHFMEYGNFNVSSIEGLQNMYFLPSDETLLIGDARYLDPTNGVGYYKSTDAGFMRVLLFFGVPMSILFYSLWSTIILMQHNRLKHTLPFSMVLLLSILMLSFIFQYKGQFIFVAVSFNKIIFILFFYMTLCYKDELKMKFQPNRLNSKL